MNGLLRNFPLILGAILLLMPASAISKGEVVTEYFVEIGNLLPDQIDDVEEIFP